MACYKQGEGDARIAPPPLIAAIFMVTWEIFSPSRLASPESRAQ
jgi:hypothetical protein